MFRSLSSVRSIVVIFLTVLLFTASCGGGGLSLSVTPNPPGGGNPPPASPIPAVTMNAIVTIFGATIDAAPGTFGPGAQVVMRDSHSGEAHGIAAGDGSFSFSNFPGGFDTSVGSVIAVSQIINGQGESAPRTVTIMSILGP